VERRHGAFFTTSNKKALKDGQGGRRAGYGSFSVSLLALSIALTCFSVAFWVTKKGGYGGSGRVVGHWPT